MAVISTFDQWQKDVFFSAAEEVQESADTMESVYRMWVRESSNGFEPEFSDELRRELHRTLGTAKWQLEEFEREVSLSHDNCSLENNTSTRHREFVVAIRDKITHIEKAVNDSLLEEGKQPLRWVQIDEEERDEFESFLSSGSRSLQKDEEKCAKHGFKEIVTISKDARYVVKVAAKKAFGKNGEGRAKEDCIIEQRMQGNSLDIDSWKIVIADEEDVDKRSVETSGHSESSTKSKQYRNSFRKAKSGEHIQSCRGFSKYLHLQGVTLLAEGINGLSERSRSCFRKFKGSPKGSRTHQIRRVGGQYNRRSLQLTLLLVLTVFLIDGCILIHARECLTIHFYMKKGLLVV